MIKTGSVTDAAVVETRLTAADGGTFDADVVFFDPSSRARVVLEVSIVTMGSDTLLGRGARAGLDGVNAQLRAREDEKRNHSVVRSAKPKEIYIKIQKEREESAMKRAGPAASWNYRAPEHRDYDTPSL